MWSSLVLNVNRDGGHCAQYGLTAGLTMVGHSVLNYNNNFNILLLFYKTKICFAFSVFQEYLIPTTVLVFVSIT